MKKAMRYIVGNNYPSSSNQDCFVKKGLLASLVVILLLVFASSCDTKDRYLSNFENFVTDVEQNGDSYSEQDWNAAAEEYDAFVGDYLEQYSDQLTKDDNKQIGRLKARYHKAWIKYASSQIRNAISASSQIAAGYLEEMANDCGMDEMDSLQVRNFKNPDFLSCTNRKSVI